MSFGIFSLDIHTVREPIRVLVVHCNGLARHLGLNLDAHISFMLLRSAKKLSVHGF